MKARHLVFFGALTVCVAIFANVWLDPHIQFTSFNANIDAVMIACLMPTVMAIVSLPIANRTARLAFRSALVLVALIGLCGASVVELGSMLAGGPDFVVTTTSTGRYTLLRTRRT